MKNLIFWVSAVLMLVFWPLSFVLANLNSWMAFVVATTILILDWILYLKKFKYHYFLYLILPLLHPAYLIFPIIAAIWHLKDAKKIAVVIYAIAIIIISIFSVKTFYAYSIFTPDPLAKDTLIKKISLIPNRNLARIFKNRTSVYQDKYKSNLFITLDLNNYFFALHPQELGSNQNLIKFPYLAIIPFLLGLFYFWKNRDKAWIFQIFLVSILSVGLINNQDRFDLLLYVPISLICISGLMKLKDLFGKYFWIFSLIFIPISLIELIRLIIYKS